MHRLPQPGSGPRYKHCAEVVAGLRMHVMLGLDVSAVAGAARDNQGHTLTRLSCAPAFPLAETDAEAAGAGTPTAGKL